MKFLSALLLGTMLAAPAFALDACKSSADDPQVRNCDYSPDQRYIVSGLVGFPVNLTFDAAEHIKRVDFAYTGLDDKGNPAPTWRGPAPLKQGEQAADRYVNNLPIWPFKDGHSALLVVTMTADGKERPYLFDLTARKAAEDCTQTPSGPGCPSDLITTRALLFSYPADVAAAQAAAAAARKQAAIAAWQGRQAKLREQAAVERLKVDPFYGQQNWHYEAKADPQYKYLQPSQVSDNGWLTEMQWPENVQIPTITIIDPATHEERMAPVTTQGRMQIISTTAEWFRLRLGAKAVMDIHNLAWKAERPDPGTGTGTTSPDVVRTVIYQNQAPR